MQRVLSSRAILSTAIDLSATLTMTSTPPSSAVSSIRSGAGAQAPMDMLFPIHFRGICLVATAVSTIENNSD